MSPIIILIITIAVAVGLFFLLRNINLWYFRINDGLTKMDKQIEILEQIKNHLSNGHLPTKSDESNIKKTFDSNLSNKVENYTKSNNIYVLTNGDKYNLVQDGDFFFFEYGDKKYYYADVNAAENSLNEIAIGKDPSKKDLVSIRNK